MWMLTCGTPCAKKIFPSGKISFSLFSVLERANRIRLESLIMIEWFDDLKLGMRFSSGKATVSKEDILRFAEEFDPQPFHLDEEAAKDTILGGLAASGWHTAALAMRLAITAKPFGLHPLFGAGVDELRWLKPVRPGDTLHLEGELVELIPSKSKPQGVARVKWTAYNQDGEAVYTFNPIAIVPRRPACFGDLRGTLSIYQTPHPQGERVLAARLKQSC